MDPDPASPIGPGSVIGGFVIESVLGTGGTSTVYLVRPLNSAQPVVLKVLHSASAAPAAPTLHHPKIVPIYAHGQTAHGSYWIAMKYASGSDADSELRAGRMPPARAVRIIAGVAEALDYAQVQGVVHGDVKPSNFLLADQDRVLLADFGSPPFATNGTVLTTAAYASPEMLRGEALDARADIYSLGCSLFRLLTGKPPFFDAGSKDDIVQSHLHRAAPRVTRYAPWLPPAMDDVVVKAMAKDPRERYQSASELAHAASAALGNNRKSSARTDSA